MNEMCLPDVVVDVIRSFIQVNEGDEATVALIISIGAELLDVSSDTMVEMINYGSK